MTNKVHYGGDEALEARVDSLESSRGVADGLATLDGDGQVPVDQLGNATGGGATGIGDRARLRAESYDSGTATFPLTFWAPQPDAASVPAGWSESDNGVLVPAGAYWVTLTLTAEATEAGVLVAMIDFLAGFNASGSWTVSGGIAANASGGGFSEVSVPVEAAETKTISASGVLSTKVPDAIIVGAFNPPVTTAATIFADLYVTKVG